MRHHLFSPTRWLLAAVALAVTWVATMFTPIGRVLTTLWPPTGPTKKLYIPMTMTTSTWAPPLFAGLIVALLLTFLLVAGWGSGAWLAIAVVTLCIMMLIVLPVRRVAGRTFA